MTVPYIANDYPENNFFFYSQSRIPGRDVNNSGNQCAEIPAGYGPHGVCKHVYQLDTLIMTTLILCYTEYKKIY